MSANVNRFGQELTAKQASFMALLLAGSDVAEAAEQTGIAEKTGHKWLSLPHFQVKYRQAQEDLFAESMSALKAGMKDILTTLRRHITAEVEVTPASQVQAMKLWADLRARAEATGDEEQSAYDVRELLRLCDEQELETIQAIIERIDARRTRAKQSQPIPSIRMVK